jgi:hypothetical protein
MEQELFDEVIALALDMLRLSAQEKAKAAKRLLELQNELADLLGDFNTDTKDTARVERFIKKIDVTISDKYDELQNQLDIPGIAAASAEGGVGMLQTVLGLDAINAPTTAYFKSVASDVLIQGAPSADWWRGQSTDLTNKFAQQTRLGMGAGETNQQIINRIVGKSGVPGIMTTARNNAAALVQTSVQTVANDARRTVFEANPDFIKGIRQVSTLDSHTTIICVSYSGASWNLEKEPINGTTLKYGNGTPRHWNCRSVEVPITKTFRELGLDIDEKPRSTRSSVDGQIAADTTFDGFLKRKGKAFQDEVLGVGKADLWRDGKITLRDLVSGEGNPLTLAELQAKVAKRKA